MKIFIGLILVGLCFVGLFYFVFYQTVVNRAITSWVIPYLSKLDYHLVDHKYPGLFSSGDFAKDKPWFVPVFMEGFPINLTYVFVYIKRKNADATERITIEVRTLFFKITDVKFSDNLSKSSLPR